MTFHDDWNMSKKRFEAFWAGEIIDRPLIAVLAPRSKPLVDTLQLKMPKDLAEKWMDIDYRTQAFLYDCSHTYFGGDSFPNFFNNLGPGFLSACIGGSYQFGEETVWFDTEQMIKDWNTPPDLELKKSSPMYQLVLKMTEHFAKYAREHYINGISDIGGSFDILASLRGTQTLLFDLYDYPDEVMHAIERIQKAWFLMYDALYYSITAYQNDGITTWMPIWSEKRYYPLQCDFSAMISPDMFARFVKPVLQKEAQFLDRSIYHLDGVGEIPHLEHLLEISEIDGIQWTAGAGRPIETDEAWYPMYERILKAGKRLVLFSADSNKLEQLYKTFSARGIYIQTHCETQKQAETLIEKVATWI